MGYFGPFVALGQDLGLFRLQVIESVTLLTPEFDDVAKSGSRDHSGLSAGTDDQRVGGNRCAMAKVDDLRLGGIAPSCIFERLFYACGNSQGGIARGAGDLPDVNAPARLIERADVREGAPGIHTHS